MHEGSWSTLLFFILVKKIFRDLLLGILGFSVELGLKEHYYFFMFDELIKK